MLRETSASARLKRCSSALCYSSPPATAPEGRSLHLAVFAFDGGFFGGGFAVRSGFAFARRHAVFARLFVEGGAGFLERGHQAVAGGGDQVRRGARFERIADVLDSGLDLGADFRGQLVAGLGDGLLGLVGERVGAVADFHLLAALAVLLGVGVGVLLHALDLFVGEAGAGLDRDLLLAAGALVAGGDVEDAVGVDVEGDLDLGQAAGRGQDAVQDEAAERLVIAGQGALALDDVYLDRGLAVAGGGEDLRLRGGDGGVAGDDRGGDAAQRLDAEGQRGDVQQEDLAHVALEDAGLDRRAHGHDLVRVDALVGLAAEELLDRLDDHGHAGLAADQDHLTDLAGGDLGVLEGLAAGVDRVLA